MSDTTPAKSSPTTTAEAYAQAAALDAPLNARLATYVQLSRPIVPEIAEAYDRMLARLAVIAQDGTGPCVGEPMPPFVLPDQEGRLVTLEHLTRQGPLVVSFNRGHWCPFCRLQLSALAAINDEVVRLGAATVSIVPEGQAQARRMIAERKLPFSVLSDMDYGYALSLDLLVLVDDALNALYRARGIDLAWFQANSGQFLPIPALFVVGRDGRVIARLVEPDFRRRMEPADILAALRSA